MTGAIWVPALTQARTLLEALPATRPDDRASAVDAFRHAISDAESALITALSEEPGDQQALIAALIGRAADLLKAAAGLAGKDDRVARTAAAAALTSEFDHLETAILGGETTYKLDAADTRRPLDRAARALRHLEDDPQVGVADRIALRTASAELAALLVRAAANLQTRGSAQHASVEASDSLATTIETLVGKIAESADAPPASRADLRDPVGRRLCEALRVPVDLTSLDALESSAQTVTATRDALAAARHAWLALAVREYAVTSTLEAQLPALEYKLKHGSALNAVAAASLNILCGARLLSRPGAFRHRRAWGRQGIALSHAIEAYINGIRGNRDALAQAQLIVMTRLVRSITALALIDAQQHNISAGSNGHTRR